MAKAVSGKAAIKILTKHYGFFVISQRGSHIKLQKVVNGSTVTTVVPNHKELARGTLRGILRLAKVLEKDFWKHV